MQVLVALHRPNDSDILAEADSAMHADIDALNDEMVAAGVRVFVGGLQPHRFAKSIRPQPDGSLSVTAGLYLQSGEHVDGFWILEVADLDVGLEWGRKASLACRAPVEVRPFH